MKHIKVIIACMMMFLTLSCLSVNALSDTGHIELSFQTNQAKNVSFSAYKIGDLLEGSTVQYVPCTSFEDLKDDMKSLKTAKDCEKVIESARKIISQNNIQPVKTVKGDDQGNMVFNDLKMGLYLIQQDDTNEFFKAEPIIVALPEVNDQGINETVVAKPKFVVTPPTPEKPKEEKPKIKTGDDITMTPYMTMGILALTMMGVILTYKKKALDI